MILFNIIFLVPALLIVITIHEFSHAWLADRLGDPTPRQAGRVTLNPLAHLDFFGTLFLIFFRFGWGKPVPINPRFFRHPLKESAFVALAGPFSNFVFALLVGGVLVLFRDALPSLLFKFLMLVFDLNLVLCIFNLLPLPPLDGSKVLGLFIPKKYHDAYEHFLETGTVYTILFLLFDFMVLSNIFGEGIISRILFFISVPLKSAIFLQ